MRAFVSLSRTVPAAVDSPDCVVVIDVLRSATVAAAALAAGAVAVRMFATVEETLAAARSVPPERRLLAGERGYRKIPGFDCGNSPSEFTPERVAGRTVFMTTTNGPAAVAAEPPGVSIFYACWAVSSATARAVRAVKPRDVKFVCSGTRRLVSLEDVVCAGRIASLLGCEPGDDGARLAECAFREYGDPARFASMLPFFEGGRKLREMGMERDLAPCAELDAWDFALAREPGGTAFVAVR